MVELKIAASTTSGGLEDRVAHQFGRAKTFTLVEISGEDVLEVKVVENPATELPSGAGIRAAQLVADMGVDAVLTGNVGEKAFEVLKRAGIKIFDAAGFTVKDAVDKLRKGELEEIISARGKKWR